MWFYVLWCLLLGKLIVTFDKVDHLEKEDLGKTMVELEADDFRSFKTAILDELQEMKNKETKLENEILKLQMGNEIKDRKLEELEKKLELMGKGQCHTKVKGRRQVSDNVAFTAYLDHSVHNLTQDQPIIYNKVLLNDGGWYNTQTGIFRVPVSGVYLFSYSVGAKILPGVHLKQYDVFTRLMVDGTHQLSAVAESTSSYDDEQGSTTAIIFVEEAATVWTKHEYRGGNNLYSDDTERVTSFAGTLLYEKETAVDTGIIG